MPRENYDYLHPATQATLKGNTAQMAIGWNKSERRIYHILSEDAPDYFPAFLSMYAAACRAGISTAAWDAELEHERSRNAAKPASAVSISTHVNRSLQKHHRVVTSVIEAMDDGVLTPQELEEIERLALDASDADMKLLQAIRLKREELENGNRGYAVERPQRNGDLKRDSR